MLNEIEVELEFISDVGMYLFFEKGTRGRISYISKRYSKANNKYLKSYHSKQELKHVIYLCVNNSYGYAMSKFLSTSGFKWMDPKKFGIAVIVMKVCVLEDDFGYLKELCELHNDYPLAPGEKKTEKF